MDYQILPVDLVKPSPMNPRKTIEDSAIAELAGNIKAQGLIQPITVRPVAFFDRVENGVVVTTPKRYEIVCGERRFRAFSKLNESHPDGSFSKIPAIVRTMSDAEAFDAMITENLQRQDVDPIEEAFAFGQLIKNGKTAEEIALRFGKSIRFVQDRIKLNSLIPELMVAVKDDKMSISAAMIISKLDEKDQRQFYKTYTQHYQGFSKSNAERFTDGLFMRLDGAAWHTDREDFEGGCDCKCSECKFNTNNHGCLFYEMNGNEDGRCTNREMFITKSISYIEQVLKSRESELVRKNEPLVKGKTVLAGYKPQSYNSEETKRIYEKVKAIVDKMGLEFVDPYTVFNGSCYYESDDERLQKKLEDGEVYHYLMLIDTVSFKIEDKYGYVNKKDLSINCDENGLPLKVKNIIGSIEQEEKTIDSAIVVAGAKAINEYKTKIDSETPLEDYELEMLMALLLKSNWELYNKLYDSSINDDEKITEFVRKHKQSFSYIVRSYICLRLSETQSLHLLRGYLDKFGTQWLQDEYNKAIEGVNKKHEKTKARAITELAKLGYDINGNKLKTEEKPKDYIAEHAKMKEKHPDSVILFRVGDFYETFGEDAKTVSETLDITLTQRKASKGTEIALCGFPYHTLDTYLPKLIKGGVRVAICEDKK